MEKNSRRNFLKKSVAASAGGVLISNSMNASESAKKEQPIKKIRPLGFQWETQDPFLFCVHHEDFFPKGNDEMGPDASLKGRNIGSDFHIKDGWRMYHGKKVPGFPGHPHRGFETITVVRKGIVDHTDSMGASGRYGNGDVQWMTAGKGLQHAEMFPLIQKDQDNPLELFQIWLNLPKVSKFVEPHFKMLWSESIPVIQHKDSAGKISTIEVIAGKLADKEAPTPTPNSWAADTENDVSIWNIRMEPGAFFTLPKAKEGVNRTIYFYEGDELKIENSDLKEYHSADVEATIDLTLKAGNTNCNLLILQGKPIDEPVVQHGPFVMNTREEIRDAFNDYQQTQFGGWPWPEYEYVHPRDQGRFAKHADGRTETMS